MTKPKPAFEILEVRDNEEWSPFTGKYERDTESVAVHFRINKRLKYTNPRTKRTAVWVKGSEAVLTMVKSSRGNHIFADTKAPYGIKRVWGAPATDRKRQPFVYECLETFQRSKSGGSCRWIVPTVDNEAEGVALAINTTLQHATNLDGYDGAVFSNAESARVLYQEVLGIDLVEPGP